MENLSQLSPQICVSFSINISLIYYLSLVVCEESSGTPVAGTVTAVLPAFNNSHMLVQFIQRKRHRQEPQSLGPSICLNLNI